MSAESYLVTIQKAAVWVVLRVQAKNFRQAATIAAEIERADIRAVLRIEREGANA